MALTNYADTQQRLMTALSAARVASAEASMLLDQTYYSDLSYARVPCWLSNGGIDENDETTDDGYVSFPALVRLRWSGGGSDTAEAEDEGDGGSAGEWTLEIAAPSPPAQPTASSSAADGGAAAKGTAAITARRREEAMKRVDPRHWFSSAPPRMLSDTQQRWRDVLAAAMDFARCQAAAVAQVERFEAVAEAVADE